MSGDPQGAAGRIIATCIPEEDAAKIRAELLEQLAWAKENKMPKTDMRSIILKLQALDGYIPEHDLREDCSAYNYDFDNDTARG